MTAKGEKTRSEQNLLRKYLALGEKLINAECKLITLF